MRVVPEFKAGKVDPNHIRYYDKSAKSHAQCSREINSQHTHTHIHTYTCIHIRYYDKISKIITCAARTREIHAEQTEDLLSYARVLSAPSIANSSVRDIAQASIGAESRASVLRKVRLGTFIPGSDRWHQSFWN